MPVATGDEVLRYAQDDKIEETPMLKLYYAPGACSTASHIGLEESGAKFDSQALAFAKNEQKTPEYLKINPAAACRRW